MLLPIDTLSLDDHISVIEDLSSKLESIIMIKVLLNASKSKQNTLGFRRSGPSMSVF